MSEWTAHYHGRVDEGQTDDAVPPAEGVPACHLVAGWSFGAGMFDELRRHLAGPVVAHDWRAFAADRLGNDGKDCRQGGVWLGWSLGGTLLLEAIARGRLAPDRLLLVGATPRFLAGDDWPGVPMAEWRALRRAARRDPRQAACGFRERFALPDCEQWSVGEAADVAGLDWLAQVDARELLGRLRVPTELWLAPDDPLIPADWIRHLPLSEVVVSRSLPAAGHGAIFECWQELAQALAGPAGRDPFAAACRPGAEPINR